MCCHVFFVVLWPFEAFSAACLQQTVKVKHEQRRAHHLCPAGACRRVWKSGEKTSFLCTFPNTAMFPVLPADTRTDTSCWRNEKAAPSDTSMTMSPSFSWTRPERLTSNLPSMPSEKSDRTACLSLASAFY